MSHVSRLEDGCRVSGGGVREGFFSHTARPGTSRPRLALGARRAARGPGRLSHGTNINMVRMAMCQTLTPFNQTTPNSRLKAHTIRVHFLEG